MKISFLSVFALYILTGAGIFYSNDTYALSVLNLEKYICASKETNAFASTWTCAVDTGNANIPATIIWETDQVPSSGLQVVYGSDFASSVSATLISTNRYQANITGLAPSETYPFRIITGDGTVLHTDTFRTVVADGIVRHRQGFKVHFQATFDTKTGSPIPQWQAASVVISRHGNTCQDLPAWRRTGYNCFLGAEDLFCDATFGGGYRENEWCVIAHDTFIEVFSKGWDNYDGNTGGGYDNDNSSSNRHITLYYPNPAPFEAVISVIPGTISLHRGSQATVQARFTNISEPEVIPRIVAFSANNLNLPPDIVVTGNATTCVPQINSSCDISFTIATGGSIPVRDGYTVSGFISNPWGPSISVMPFTLNILPPLPGISLGSLRTAPLPGSTIPSQEYDISAPVRLVILRGEKHQDLKFVLRNPVQESVLGYRISDDQGWLSVFPESGTGLCPECNIPQVEPTISFASTNLSVTATPYVGVITVEDTNAANNTPPVKIHIELMVTNISDFSLSVTSPPVLVQGNSVGAKVVVTRTAGIASDVTLSASGLPTGVTGVFVPAVCSAAVLASSCTSVLTLSADTSAALGPKTVTITAKKSLDQNGPAREQKKTFTLTVSKSFGVSLALSPASLEVQSGRSGTVRVLATLSGEGSKDVKFAVDGLPGGASGTFTPASCTQTCTSSLTLNAGTAGSGTSSLTIKATGSDGKSATGALSFTIKALTTATPQPTTTGGPTATPGTTPRPFPTGTPPPGTGKQPLVFSLITVKTLSVIQGSMTNTSIILSHDRGDAESVRLEISQVPARVTTSLSLTQCVPSCYSVLTLKTTEKTPLGNSNIKITASSRQAVRTAFIELIVGTDPPPAPTALLQKNIKDGAQVGVGGTVREDRIVFLGTLDNISAQKVRLRVEAKPVKEFFNGVTGVFEEPARVVERGSSYELTGSKLLGGYKWRAQTVDERGIASQWVEFGRNSDSESDFITDLSTPPTNPFEANQGESQVQQEQPGFFRRIFGWACYIPGIKKLCN